MKSNFEKAFRILLETFPFVLLRLAVYGLAIIVAVAWWVGVFWLFKEWPFPGPNWLAFVFGGVLFGGGAKLVRHYVLYLVRAAHVGVITRLAVTGDLPSGTTQFSYGAGMVFDNFLRVSVLFAADRLVSVVLKAFNRSMFKLLGAIPGLGAGQNFVKQMLEYSVGYVDEAILSYSLLYPQRNPWKTAKDGLILYVQNWKTILGSGLILAAASYVLVGLFAVPGVLLGWLLVPSFKPAVVGGFVGVGMLLKFAFMDPFALTAVIVNFHSAIEGQTPSPEWDQKLMEASPKFALIRDRAREWEATPVTPPPPPATDPAV